MIMSWELKHDFSATCTGLVLKSHKWRGKIAVFLGAESKPREICIRNEICLARSGTAIFIPATDSNFAEDLRPNNLGSNRDIASFDPTSNVRIAWEPADSRDHIYCP